MTKTTTITSLDSLPNTISSETSVRIEGHYLEESDSRNEWCLIRESDDEVVRILTVVW